jgi:predicted nuclease of predicted toxin-antitoxin system
MRFLGDMCVDVRIVRWLRENQHDATHLRDQGLHRMPNGEIFDKAIRENRIVITFDLDFGEIAALTEGRKASVILFRLKNTRTAYVIERLSSAIEAFADALERGAIVIVEDTRYRVRYFPIGIEAGENRRQPGTESDTDD